MRKPPIIQIFAILIIWGVICAKLGGCGALAETPSPPPVFIQSKYMITEKQYSAMDYRLKIHLIDQSESIINYTIIADNEVIEFGNFTGYKLIFWNTSKATILDFRILFNNAPVFSMKNIIILKRSTYSYDTSGTGTGNLIPYPINLIRSLTYSHYSAAFLGFLLAIPTGYIIRNQYLIKQGVKKWGE